MQTDNTQDRPNQDGGDVYYWDEEKGEWAFYLHYDATRPARVFDLGEDRRPLQPSLFPDEDVYTTILYGSEFYGVMDLDT